MAKKLTTREIDAMANSIANTVTFELEKHNRKKVYETAEYKNFEKEFAKTKLGLLAAAADKATKAFDEEAIKVEGWDYGYNKSNQYHDKNIVTNLINHMKQKKFNKNLVQQDSLLKTLYPTMTYYRDIEYAIKQDLTIANLSSDMDIKKLMDDITKKFIDTISKT